METPLFHGISIIPSPDYPPRLPDYLPAAGKDLRGSKFEAQNLAGSRFDGSDLSTVSFTECNLSGASFKGACLAAAYLDACNLAEADFTDAIVDARHPSQDGLFVSGGVLSEKQFKSTRSYREKKLVNCLISAPDWDTAKRPVRFDFRGANLTRAALLSGDFTECDFTDAVIDGIQIDGARISFKQLASTWDYKNRRLRGVTLSNSSPGATVPGNGGVIDGRVDLAGFDLTGILISGPSLPDADFTNATITGGSFSDNGITTSQLRATRNYREGNLARIRFWYVDLAGCDLSRQNLAGCHFAGCTLTKASFQDAIITDANFSALSHPNPGLTIEQIKATWNYKQGRMAGVKLPKDIADALSAEASAKE